MGSEQSVAPGIRPVSDDDVEALVQLTLAAFVPVFRSFEQMPGPEIYRMIWPDWRAGQQKAVAAVPPEKRPAVTAAGTNRLADHGQTTPDLERYAAEFVRFAAEQTKQALAQQPELR
jgi:hypothetical protein